MPPPHPLAGRHIFATGAPSDGYLISASGIVNANDAKGCRIRNSVFKLGRGLTIEEATHKLEEYVHKHSGIDRASRAWNFVLAYCIMLIYADILL